ncbi:hypothetical protein [Cryptosporangium arvum]|jgi:hypothetical protein|uniref:hypothetical protein n=1 Tax=Cryptosporangium arvum TaxID=80871 RepID=UPI0004AF245A|nr:hypothetical protein [Cryptosporangium arvum]
MIMALLLDFANIAGGLLLAAALLQRLPKVGDDLGLAARAAAPYGWIVGLVALVTGGYYLLVHVTDGPRVFHFELVGIAIGVALLWDRLRGRRGAKDSAVATTTAPTNGSTTVARTRSAVEAPAGVALLLAVFGIIAVIVGFQGLLTPDY